MPSTGSAGIIARVAPAAGSKRGGWIWARRDPSTGDGVMPLTLAAFWTRSRVDAADDRVQGARGRPLRPAALRPLPPPHRQGR